MASLGPHVTESEVSLTITAKTFFKVVLLVIVTFLLLGALKQASYALTLVFTAFFLAVALNAPVSWVSRHLPGSLRGSRALATTLSFLIVIIILGTFLVSIVPPIVRQTQTFISNAPKIVQSIHNNNSQVSKFIDKYHLQKQINTFSSELSQRLQHSGSAAIATIVRIGSSIFATVTILVLTFMMLVEGPRWLRFIRQLTPKAHRDHADQLIHDMYKAVKGYVNGQVVLAALASFMLLPGLLIFHVSYPIALMAVVFICALIPMVGHIIGTVIVTIVALFHSPFSAIGVLIYYVLYQQIEAYLIQPRIQANTTNLSPLLVLLSVVVGVSFGGLVGGLVALPTVACIRVAVIDYLQRKHLLVEDPTLQPAATQK